MRLTLINQFYKPDLSPTAHLCASLAEHRAAMGDCVTVLTSRAGYAVKLSPRPIGNGPQYGPNKTVHVRRLWSTRFGSRSNIGRLLDWVTFYLPTFWAAATMPRQDVVIAMTTPPFIALAGWLHKLIHPGSRFILWNMDVYPEALERTNLTRRGSIVSRLMRSANRAIFRRLDHLVTLDGAMAKLLLSQYVPLNRNLPYSIIPNFEAMALFPKTDFADERNGDFVVLYLGNAGYGHEFQTLIDVADLLRNEPVKFQFTGGGSLWPWIKTAAAQRGLDNIILQNYVPKEQTPCVMRTADLALITLENSMAGVMSPSKLHANLAMGLPILYVGPQGSNVDEAISRFGCGISLRPGQSTLMAAFIRKLLVHRTGHAELRRRSRAAFEQAYCDGKTLPAFDVAITGLAPSYTGSMVP